MRLTLILTFFQIRKIGETTVGQDQYALKKYSEAFESVPRILAENAGMDPTEAITKLYARHEAAEGVNIGVNVDVCELFSFVCIAF
jgi:T-complex protein 1 subunit theta